MKTEINIGKEHLAFLGLAMFILFGGILFNSYASVPTGFIGHEASEITVNFGGDSMSLADAMPLFVSSAISGSIVYDSPNCHIVEVNFQEDVEVNSHCNLNEVVSEIETTTYSEWVGDVGEWYISKIKCCPLILS
ncbi:hypothetical protein HOA59_00450 [archaeon]|jgi:hypothetical protein|nr:hypothetical protein [archaeon]